VDIFPLLDELQTIARNGLTYAENPYDKERYERLLELAATYYSQAVDIPPEEVRQRFRAELGHITPKVGANAAIFNAEGQILLMQRSDNAKWCLPCGWLDPDESPAEAAVRETREETGLEVNVSQLVDVFTRKASIQFGPHPIVVVVYLCQVTGGELRLSHEGLALDYCPIEAVEDWHGLHDRYARAAHSVWQGLARRRGP
jgi:ADP-ribose pyrophosphatase YjhB (NUDIX family)